MEQDLVPIRFFDDPLEAHMARCVLENSGIEAYVHDEHTISLNRLLGVALGGVKLKVSTVDLEAAIRVLNESDSLPYLDENETVLSCPRCGSSQLRSGVSRPRNWQSIGHLFMAFALSIYPLGLQRGMSCDECDHFFQQE